MALRDVAFPNPMNSLARPSGTLRPSGDLETAGLFGRDRTKRGPLLEVRAAQRPVDHQRDDADGQAAQPDPDDHRVTEVRGHELAQDPEHERGPDERPDADQQEV